MQHCGLLCFSFCFSLLFLFQGCLRSCLLLPLFGANSSLRFFRHRATRAATALLRSLLGGTPLCFCFACRGRAPRCNPACAKIALKQRSWLEGSNTEIPAVRISPPAIGQVIPAVGSGPWGTSKNLGILNDFKFALGTTGDILQIAFCASTLP